MPARANRRDAKLRRRGPALRLALRMAAACCDAMHDGAGYAAIERLLLSPFDRVADSAAAVKQGQKEQ